MAQMKWHIQLSYRNMLHGIKLAGLIMNIDAHTNSINLIYPVNNLWIIVV